MPTINVSRVSKCFDLHSERDRSLQELFQSILQRRGCRRRHEYLWALRDVSFGIESGESVALIGPNGSGKSTCLKLLTRILEPTTGTVTVSGRTASLLELGAGFHPDLTGRENITLYGSVLGFGRREMAARFDEIVEFAELRRFIDVPVKFYSSGMYVRLAFATAISVSPEVLLVDEVLAVGDQSFQDKCLGRIEQMKRLGVTIVLVSHSLEAVQSLCDRAIWLEEGRLIEDGPTSSVIRAYLGSVYDDAQALAWLRLHGDLPLEGGPGDQAAELPSLGEPSSEQEADLEQDEKTAQSPAGEPTGSVTAQQSRWGTRRAEILNVTIMDGGGHPCEVLLTGYPMTIAIDYVAHERLERPAFGIAIYDGGGTQLAGTNTLMARCEIHFIEGKGRVLYRAESLPLLAGQYYLSVAIHNEEETEAFDYSNLGYAFRVELGAATPHLGLIHVPANWVFEPGKEEA